MATFTTGDKDTIDELEAVVTEMKGVPVDGFSRAREMRVWSCMRPWYRAFHFSWMSFFLAFLGWFAIVPAMEYIIKDPANNVTVKDAKLSGLMSVLGTIFVRFALGPLCEKIGPRRLQAGILLGGAVAVGASAFINSRESLIGIRFVIGLIGGAFVPCQYWTSMMYASNVVGNA